MAGYNLKPFRAGEPLLKQLTAARMNGLIDAINRSNIIFGDNVYGQRTPGGAIVKVRFPTGESFDMEVSFLLIDASAVGEDDEISNKVRVYTGYVNSELPTDMVIDEDFIVDIENPDVKTFIVVEITYDVPSLTVTSADINQYAVGDLPEDGIDPDNHDQGSFFVELGFTYIDEDGDFRVIQTHLGDIDFELIYTLRNSVQALLAVPAYSAFMDVPDDDE
jgi:hypothetical protein